MDKKEYKALYLNVFLVCTLLIIIPSLIIAKVFLLQVKYAGIFFWILVIASFIFKKYRPDDVNEVYSNFMNFFKDGLKSTAIMLDTPTVKYTLLAVVILFIGFTYQEYENERKREIIEQVGADINNILIE